MAVPMRLTELDVSGEKSTVSSASVEARTGAGPHDGALALIGRALRLRAPEQRPRKRGEQRIMAPAC